MAKLKSLPDDASTVPEETGETVAAPANEFSTIDTASSDIPDSVVGLLKIYKNLPGLYVDKSGGVFLTDTAEQVRQEAIFYKNPYYEKH